MFINLFYFRESGRERETSTGCLLYAPCLGGIEHATYMCPDQRSNLLPFGVREDAPTNWATQPVLHRCFNSIMNTEILFLVWDNQKI